MHRYDMIITQWKSDTEIRHQVLTEFRFRQSGKVCSPDPMICYTPTGAVSGIQKTNTKSSRS